MSGSNEQEMNHLRLKALWPLATIVAVCSGFYGLGPYGKKVKPKGEPFDVTLVAQLAPGQLEQSLTIEFELTEAAILDSSRKAGKSTLLLTVAQPRKEIAIRLPGGARYDYRITGSGKVEAAGSLWALQGSGNGTLQIDAATKYHVQLNATTAQVYTLYDQQDVAGSVTCSWSLEKDAPSGNAFASIRWPEKKTTRENTARSTKPDNKPTTRPESSGKDDAKPSTPENVDVIFSLGLLPGEERESVEFTIEGNGKSYHRSLTVTPSRPTASFKLSLPPGTYRYDLEASASITINGRETTFDGRGSGKIEVRGPMKFAHARYVRAPFPYQCSLLETR